jgi:hypothetical protein
MSIAVLRGNLVAGLWPFQSPRNSVTWLGGENGLRFGEAGTIVSAGEVRLTVTNEPACSVEIWGHASRRFMTPVLCWHSTRAKTQSNLPFVSRRMISCSNVMGSPARRGQKAVAFTSTKCSDRCGRYYSP